MQKPLLPLTLLILLALGSRPALAQSWTQHWLGSQEADGSSQALILNLTPSPTPKGTVDLPDFGASGIPASNLTLASGNIHFELIGDNSTTVFEGSLLADVIQGSWKDGAHSGAFHLHLRPATAASPIEKAVAFANRHVLLSGSFLIPGGKGPYPAIVLLHGAGAEARNASCFMAEFFVQRGVAALIYDKRGVGESAGDWKTSSFEDLAGDAVAAVNYLLSQPEINRSQIGLMGSSQGGWIAPMAALLSPNISFVIVKSAAGVTPEQEELARTERSMRDRNLSPADTQEALALYKQMIDYSFTGSGWEPLSAAQEKASQAEWGGFGIFPRDSWWFKFIKLNFRHDPIPVLQQVRCPVLVIFGGKDPNLPVDASVLNVNQALAAHPSASLVAVFPSAGHDLRVLPTPRDRWSFPRFAPGYLDLLASWVKAQTSLSVSSAP